MKMDEDELYALYKRSILTDSTLHTYRSNTQIPYARVLSKVQGCKARQRL